MKTENKWSILVWGVLIFISVTAVSLIGLLLKLISKIVEVGP